MKRLSGKVALVTGASKGIGAGIATAFGAEGASVIVNYATSKEGADRVVEKILSSGGRALAVQGDVSKRADVERLFATARDEFGVVDILVNNAAVYKFELFESVTEEEFHRHVNTNLLSVFLTTQEAVKQFGANGGNVINIATVGVALNAPYASLYTATKSAMVSLTKILSKELGSRKIRVNAISPGCTETEGMHAIDFIGTGADTKIIEATPLGRLGQPEDIAPVAVFLASDESAWVTGETIYASGGL
jgi:3-oxoacyl-[acyl-carrier protein] reductase